MDEPRPTDDFEPATETIQDVSLDGLNAQPPDRLGEGTLLGGRHEIRAMLGRGGNATVYSAVDHELGHAVALKVLHRHRVTANALRRIRREARIARELEHPNLLRVFDLASEADRVYLTMELVEGETLADRLARKGRLDIDEALEVALPVLDALESLHERGIYHRDVKPSNVLIGADGRVKLGDFGLALLPDQEETRLTASQAVVGTLRYLSPEQALGKPPTPASDLYSFGLVLFELLTGGLPHDESESALGDVLARVSQRPKSLREVRPEIPRWLDAVVMRLLEPKTVHRYPSAGAVKTDLVARRSPGRRLRGRAALALGAGALAAVVFIAFPRPPRLHSVDDRNGTLEGRSEQEDVIWAREDLGPTNAAILHAGGAPRWVAATPKPASRGNQTLRLLSPKTGATLDELDMQSPAEYFQNFADTYKFQPFAFDLAADGSQELLIKSYHYHEPSATFEVNVRTGRQSNLFVGTGHHTPIAVTDLDGDGDRDLILAGLLNPAGWRVGIAAVDLDVSTGDSGTAVPATTPDRPDPQGSRLLWYSIYPSTSCRDGTTYRCVEVDEESRRLHFAFTEPLTLDFDGLTPRDDGLPSADRSRLRNAAWASWRDGLRRLEASDFAQAESSFESGFTSARDAGEQHLAELLLSSQASALALLGHSERARELIESSTLSAHGAADADFDVAVALNTRGRLEEALPWYASAMRRDLTRKRGRSADVLIVPWALAASQLAGAAEPGLRLLGRWMTGPRTVELRAMTSALLLWRYDGGISNIGWNTNREGAEEARYLALELRAASNEPTDMLLAEIDEELAWASYTRPALGSLRAKLMASTDEAAARRAIETVYLDAKAERSRSPLTWFLFDVVEERWREIGGAGSLSTP